MSDHPKDWPHAPIHRLNSDGVFMVTGATLYKNHFFSGAEKLDLLEGTLLTLAKEYQWQLEAWSVFSNHYHFVGRGNGQAGDMGIFLKHLHGETARKLNLLDQLTGRQVWYNFWDTELTFEKFLSRASELCSSESSQAWSGTSSEPISLVLCGVVRENCVTRDGENYL